jgi:hypothetical protein
MDELGENDKKWSFIHTLMKSTIHSVMSSVWYFMHEHTIRKKEEFQSNEIKRIIAAWDIAFDEWEKELSLQGYRNSENYTQMVRMRNVMLTLIESDGPYKKLLYQMLKAWEKVKEDDVHLTTPSEPVK